MAEEKILNTESYDDAAEQAKYLESREKQHAEDFAKPFDPEAILSSMPKFAVTPETEASIRSMNAAGEELVERAADTVAAPITALISNIIGYILVFILSFAVLTVVAWLIQRLIKKIKILKVTDRLLGALLGVLFSFLLCILLASLLKFFFGNTEIGESSVALRIFAGKGILRVFRFLDLSALLSSLRA